MFRVQKFIRQFSGKTIALSVCDLETSREINIHADVSMHPASTIKVPVLMEVYRQVEAGSLSLADHIPVTNAFTSIYDGSPFSLDEKDDSDKSLYGKICDGESIRELARLMIVRSSNLATNLLLELVGAKQVNDLLLEYGINNVSVLRGVEDNAAYRAGMNNRASARGLTKVMKCIAEEKLVSKSVSEEMVRIMLGQEFNESIPALLPPSVKVAHKTGWTGEFYHDTGIVFLEQRQPYAISIMTQGFPEDDDDQAHTCMAEISRLVYAELVSPTR